jgi:hypothetical protein
MKRRITAIAFTALLALVAKDARAQIAAADLQIQGVGLRVVDRAVATGVDIPSFVQTEFGGKQNDEAPQVEDLIAVAELTGPGIEAPIRLETAPGHKFEIPALAQEGVYFLQNIRLMKGREFLQEATPSIVAITVSNLLQTKLRVRQLTPEELRARGISVDGRNFDVYEYTFSFIVNGELVEIPFPVIIDPRTHEVRQYTPEQEYKLPPITQIAPPRWTPPAVIPFELGPGADFPVQQRGPASVLRRHARGDERRARGHAGHPRQRHRVPQTAGLAAHREVDAGHPVQPAGADHRRRHRRHVPHRTGEGRGRMGDGGAASRHAHDRRRSARHLQIAGPAGLPAQGNGAHLGDRARSALQHHLLASRHGPQGRAVFDVLLHHQHVGRLTDDPHRQ